MTPLLSFSFTPEYLNERARFKTYFRLTQDSYAQFAIPLLGARRTSCNSE